MACLPGAIVAALCLAGPAASPPSPGCPPPVACWAILGRTPAYSGCYVGGGSACGGEARASDEGTWGWDYQGRLCLRKIWLRWTHGRRYQGGEGAYKTDGPHVPNVLSVPPLHGKAKH